MHSSHKYLLAAVLTVMVAVAAQAQATKPAPTGKVPDDSTRRHGLPYGQRQPRPTGQVGQPSEPAAPLPGEPGKPQAIPQFQEAARTNPKDAGQAAPAATPGSNAPQDQARPSRKTKP